MSAKTAPPSPHLAWDIGTAYDFFISLHVLHHPNQYSLRGAWAAGVRSRVPSPARELLEEAANQILAPLAWLYSLPQPKDGQTLLRCLEALPPVERLRMIMVNPAKPTPAAEIFERVSTKGRWDENDRQALTDHFKTKQAVIKRDAETTLEWWRQAEEIGQRYLEALKAYYKAFFAEEEKRILPALEESLARAQEMASRMALPELVEELSEGVRYSGPLESSELVLTPSFWATPLIVQSQIGADREILLFGARPADASIVPGEVIPDALFRALKALADPTRLRILRYLTAAPLTPSELAQQLRLRPPTVIHHLHILRLAGLVHLTLEDKEKRYAIRKPAIAVAFTSLEQFLAENDKLI